MVSMVNSLNKYILSCFSKWNRELRQSLEKCGVKALNETFFLKESKNL